MIVRRNHEYLHLPQQNQLLVHPKLKFDWVDKDARPHAFIMFNIKPTIACQFQDKDVETANKLWIAIKSKYHRTNHAQMIALESPDS